MKIIVQDLTYTKVFLTETSTYKSLEFTEEVLKREEVYTAEWPNEVFLTLLSTAPTE